MEIEKIACVELMGLLSQGNYAVKSFQANLKLKQLF